MTTVQQILRLKQALRVARTGESFEEPEIIHTTNRGHKLEHGARYVSSQSLKLPLPEDPDSDYENDKYDLDDVEGDLKIDVAKILQPISDPAEVSSHAPIKHIFMNPFIRQLSDELLDELVRERDFVAQIVKLLESLLGDDDLDLMPQVMVKSETHQPYPTPEPGQPLPPVPDDLHWFFQQPKLKHDRDLGLGETEAQELREKLQVVQQQMEEYNRCISQIRSDLNRTLRLRRNVLNWCREMNNEDYVKADLDEQNNFDNAGLGDQPDKDLYRNGNADAINPANPDGLIDATNADVSPSYAEGEN